MDGVPESPVSGSPLVVSPVVPPARPPVWQSWLAFVLLLVTLPVAGGVLYGIAAGWTLGRQSSPSADESNVLDALLRADASVASFGSAVSVLLHKPQLLALVLAVTTVLTIGAGYLGARIETPRVAERVRWKWNRPSVALIATTLFAVLGYDLISDYATSLLPEQWRTGSSVMLLSRNIQKAGPITFAALLVFVGLVGPFGEELLFRGLMQTRFVERWGRWGIVWTAMAFGFMHMDRVQSPFAAGVGILLGICAHRAASIQPTVAVHALNNLLSVLLSRFGADEPSHQVHGIWAAIGAVALALGLRSMLRHAPPTGTASTLAAIESAAREGTQG